MKDAVLRIQRDGTSKYIQEIVKKIQNPPEPEPEPEPTPPDESNYPKSAQPLTSLLIQNLDGLLDDSPQYKTIQIQSTTCNDPSIQKWELGLYHHLTELFIGNSCLCYLRCLSLRGFKELEKVSIGSNCALNGCEGVFEVRNCPKLSSVRIGNVSFQHWARFSVKNCPLKKLVIGDGCFCKCTWVTFEGSDGGEG